MVDQLVDLVGQLVDLVDQLVDLVDQLVDLVNQLVDFVDQIVNLVNQPKWRRAFLGYSAFCRVGRDFTHQRVYLDFHASINWFLLHDNSLTHNAISIHQFLTKKKVKVLHSPHIRQI